MRRTGLERAIDEAVEEFTAFVVDAVVLMPLDELSRLRGENLVVQADPAEVAIPELEPVSTPEVKKIRKKCSYPGCTKNQFVRGRGYCGKHFRWLKKGKIEDAEVYQAQQSPDGPQEVSEKRTKPNPSELLTVKEVAALLEITEQNVYRLHNIDQLPSGFRLGPRMLRFVRGPVEEWMRTPEYEKIRARRERRVRKTEQ